jgi:hypothetical protein
MTSAEANYKTRGDLLKIVRRYGVDGISYQGIEKIFWQAGRLGVAADLEENLAYLGDKGYLNLRLTRDHISGVERWLATMTPKGIDLLDGTIPPDPGVNVVC